MDNGDGSFKDFVYHGMDSLLRFTSKAAASLHVASDTAIERLDAAQLERRLSGLYSRLGSLSYDILARGDAVDPVQGDIQAIIEQITAVSAEIAGLRSSDHLKNKKSEEK